MKQFLMWDDDNETYTIIVHQACAVVADAIAYAHDARQRSLRVRIAIAKLSGMIEVLENQDDDLD